MAAQVLGAVLLLLLLLVHSAIGASTCSYPQWEQATAAAAWGNASDVTGGRLWFTAVYAGASTATSSQDAHASVGTLLILGGKCAGCPGPTRFSNDVWRSDDAGATWALATGAAAWPPRAHALVARTADDALYLVGGLNGNYSQGLPFDDGLYRSTTRGTTWTRIASVKAWATAQLYGLVAIPAPAASKGSGSHSIPTSNGLLLLGSCSGTENYFCGWRSNPEATAWTAIMQAPLAMTNNWSISNNQLIALPAQRQVLVLAVSSDIFNPVTVWRFEDSNSNWTQVATTSGPAGTCALVAAPVPSASTDGGIFCVPFVGAAGASAEGAWVSSTDAMAWRREASYALPAPYRWANPGGYPLVAASLVAMPHAGMVVALGTTIAEGHPTPAALMNGVWRWRCANGSVAEPQGQSDGKQGFSCCVPCSAGSAPLPSAQGLRCVACQPGTVAPSSGSSACTPCPPGHWSTVGATVCSPMCRPGHYNDNGGATCQACPGGTYLPSPNATSASQCRSCPAGAYCPPGSALPTTCPPGASCGPGVSYPAPSLVRSPWYSTHTDSGDVVVTWEPPAVDGSVAGCAAGGSGRRGLVSYTVTLVAPSSVHVPPVSVPAPATSATLHLLVNSAALRGDLGITVVATNACNVTSSPAFAQQAPAKVSLVEAVAVPAGYFVVGALALLLNVWWRHAWPRRNHIPLALALFAIAHLAADLYFVYEQLRGSPASSVVKLWTYIFLAALVLATIGNLLWVLRFLLSLRRHAASLAWLEAHPFAAVVVSLVGVVKVQQLQLMSCNAFGLSALSAPVPPQTSRTTRVATAGLALVEDAPQLVAAVAIAMDQGSWAQLPVAAALFVNTLSVLVQLLSLVVAALVACGGGGGGDDAQQYMEQQRSSEARLLGEELRDSGASASASASAGSGSNPIAAAVPPHRHPGMTSMQVVGSLNSGSGRDWGSARSSHSWLLTSSAESIASTARTTRSDIERRHEALLL